MAINSKSEAIEAKSLASKADFDGEARSSSMANKPGWANKMQAQAAARAESNGRDL